jgi:hypothetical protein
MYEESVNTLSIDGVVLQLVVTLIYYEKQVKW